MSKEYEYVSTQNSDGSWTTKRQEPFPSSGCALIVIVIIVVSVFYKALGLEPAEAFPVAILSAILSFVIALIIRLVWNSGSSFLGCFGLGLIVIFIVLSFFSSWAVKKTQLPAEPPVQAVDSVETVR